MSLVTQKGTVGPGASTTTTLSPAWDGSQPRNAGDALCCFIVATRSGSQATCTTASAGWTIASFGGFNNSTNDVTVFWAVKSTGAVGGDAAPTFTISSGTSSSAWLYEFTGNDPVSPWGTFSTYITSIVTSPASQVNCTAVATQWPGEVVLTGYGSRVGSTPTITWAGGSAALTASSFTSPTEIATAIQTVATPSTVTPSVKWSVAQVSTFGSITIRPDGVIPQSSMVTAI